jgi:hypothetical protein
MKPASEDEYKKIVKSFEGQDEPEVKVVDDDHTPEQYKKLVQYTLLKLLGSPGFVKGYIQNVKKVLEVEADDKDAADLIKEEVEQTIFEMTVAAAKKYNVSPSRKFDKTKY